MPDLKTLKANSKILIKGHKDIALTRSSAEFFLRSQLGIDFLEWLKSGVGFPEEFFFATLVRVSQKLYYQRGIVVQSMYCQNHILFLPLTFFQQIKYKRNPTCYG
jgi:hypothetical protein